MPVMPTVLLFVRNVLQCYRIEIISLYINIAFLLHSPQLVGNIFDVEVKRYSNLFLLTNTGLLKKSCA